MRKRPSFSGKLYCFSPPVMIATFLIEISFAIYIVWRYKLTNISRLVVALLLFLATFQFVEYNICGGANIGWANVGFMIITILPPLGIHLAATLAGKLSKPLIVAAYSSAVVFVAYFAVSQGITRQVCGGNYIIFDMLPGSVMYYSLYYYGWLLVGVILSWKWTKEIKKKTHQKALYFLMIGYLCLLIPTTAANIISRDTIAAVPSVMCGFAILLAFALTFGVMPNAGKLKQVVAQKIRYTK